MRYRYTAYRGKVPHGIWDLDGSPYLQQHFAARPY